MQSLVGRIEVVRRGGRLWGVRYRDRWYAFAEFPKAWEIAVAWANQARRRDLQVEVVATPADEGGRSACRAPRRPSAERPAGTVRQ